MSKRIVTWKWEGDRGHKLTDIHTYANGWMHVQRTTHEEKKTTTKPEFHAPTDAADVWEGLAEGHLTAQCRIDSQVSVSVSVSV
jgi:hypothetical protein